VDVLVLIYSANLGSKEHVGHNLGIDDSPCPMSELDLVEFLLCVQLLLGGKFLLPVSFINCNA